MHKLLLKYILLILVFSGCSVIEPITYNDFPEYVKKVELENYYRGIGLIFSTEYNDWLPYNGLYNKRYTPSKSDIIKAEKILIADYDRYVEKNEFDYNFENIQKFYWKFNRQYFGFINSHDEKLLAINLLEFNNRVISSYYFKNWKNRYMSILGGSKINNKYMINLDKREIVVF
jgi:hypothetical protein